ncbi:hypothetical protein [Azospirillum sp. ST 5-10]|uniref:hypothetical protein n=1 Tax=unclassified Azospirillum TaxID=2630922 RepID=UPI003F4A010B
MSTPCGAAAVIATDIRDRAAAPLDAGARRGIVRDLVAAMPTYGVAGYFRTKADLLDPQDVTVIARDRRSGACIGLAVAGWPAGGPARFLHVKTMLLGEAWHRGALLRAVWRALFIGLLRDGAAFPPVIALKTYNPKSFSAMRAFAHVPDTAIFPAVGPAPFPASLLPTVRGIAATLAPGRAFDERTGVIAGAADGVTGFYPALPICGKSAVDEHFRSHLTADDRLLACLFARSPRAGERILRAFGVPVDPVREGDDMALVPS